jgi:hypothetical protein
LDRFNLEALDDSGTVLASATQVDNFFQPLELPSGTTQIRVDTGDKKNGPSQTLLCQFASACP